MFDAGSISARLELDKSDFTRNLAAAKAEGAKGVTVPVKFDVAGLPGVTGPRGAITIPVTYNVDPAGLSAKLLAAQKAAALSGATTVPVTYSIDMAALSAKLRAAAKAAAVAGATTIPVKFDLGAAGLTPLEASLRGVGTSVDAMNRAVTAGNIAWTAFTPEVDKGAAATDKATVAANRAAVAWRGWGTSLPLFGGLAGATGLVHVALDAVFESLVAVGLAAAAMTVTLFAMAPAAQDISQHLKSISAVNSALGSNIPPLTGKFEALQQSMAPNVLELYGGGLNLISRQTGFLGQTVHATGTLMDTWIAKIDLWAASQTGMGKILQSGVGFLHQFGQILGNVGLAISNLVKGDPGTAHFLGDVIVGFSKLLAIITHFPALDFIVLGLHSIYLWGGLAVTSLAKLGRAAGLDTLANKLGLISTTTKVAADGSVTLEKSFLGLSSMQWGFAIAGAAALAYYTYQAFQADKGTKDFIATMDASLQSATASQAILQISSDIGALNEKIAQVKTAVQPAMTAMVTSAEGAQSHFASFSGDLSHGVLTAGTLKNAYDSVAGAVKTWLGFQDAVGTSITQHADITAYAGFIQKLTGEQVNLFREVGTLMRGTTTEVASAAAGSVLGFHNVAQSVRQVTTGAFTYTQALALMDLAGVQAGDSLAVMKQKVDNLITGFKGMGVQAGILANGVNAVTFAAELQNSKVGQLTAGYTSFIGVVSGGETTFAQFVQGVKPGVSGLEKVALAAQGGAASMNGLNAASISLRSAFEGAVSSANSVYNALTTQAAAAGLGVQGYHLLTRAGKDLVGTLLEQAKGSKAAVAQLYALAQLAGYHGADSFKALSKWVGNTKNSEADLSIVTGKLTIASANLVTDVNNLANAINQNLNQAIAAAIDQANGGQKAFDNFATSAVKSHDNVNQMRSSALALAEQLITTTGNTRQAHDEFNTFAYQLKLTKGQADNLWNSIKNVASAEAGLPATKTIGLLMEAHGEYNVSQVKFFDTAHSFFNLAGGGRITQGTGPTADDVLARVSKGETVVSATHSQALAPYFAAVGVPGYAAGGYVGNLTPAFISNSYASLQSTAENAVTGVLGPALNAATMAAAKAGQAAAIGALAGVGGGVKQWAGIANRVLQMLEGPGQQPGDLGIVLSQMTTESGGNPRAVNRTDSNWLAGHPSVGLMQVIAGTYAAYGAPKYGYPPPVAYGVSENPEANTYAGMNYGIARYGPGWRNVLGHGHGYDTGGLLMPGATLAVNSTGHPEHVIPSTGVDDIVGGLEVLASQLEDILAAVRVAPARTGAALGMTLSGVARNAGY